jgi:hypothetical protein
MVDQKFVAVCVLGWVMAGCAVQAEGTAEGGLSDAKPEDGSELAGSQFASAEQAHALHYTDGTNLWQETGYKMGTDNPNCKDWWVYDRYVPSRPPVNTLTYFSTFETSHPWATGEHVNNMLAALPNDLGYTAFHRSVLLDHNSVVARLSGKCSGRYVFQMDNRTKLDVYDFGPNAYMFAARLPDWVVPLSETTCKARAPESVPAIMIDLYVCEAWDRRSVAGSIGTFCNNTRGNWRKVESASGWGQWNTASKRCETATVTSYQPPANGKIAVSFNMVVKAGVGHAPAPAFIDVLRYN